MPHDVSTQIVGVRQEPSRDGQSIKHIVSLTGGVAADGTAYPANEYLTFSPELSAKAFSLINMPVDARLEIKQVPKRQGGGFFVNYNIEDVALQGTLPPMAMPAQGGTPAQPMQMQQQPTALPGGVQQFQQQPSPQVPQVSPQAQVIHPALAADDQRHSQEQRGFASNTAYGFIGVMAQSGLFSDGTTALLAARALTDDLLSYRLTGSWGAQSASDVSGQHAPATPEQLAQAANEELGEGAVTVGPPFDAQVQS